MTDTTAIIVAEEPSTSGVSWPAIVAGAVASLALTMVLLTLGTGLGLAVVSPWENEGVSGGTFHIASGIFLLVVATMASAVGGYLAGRLRTKWTGVQADEVYFRDTAHGFLAWALASIVGAAFLASAAAGIVNSATIGLAQGGAANVSISDNFADRMLRPAAPDATPTTPAPAINQPNNAEDARADLGRILAASLRPGSSLAADDRTYLAQIVAQRASISQEDAERRVDQVMAQAKSAADESRKAAIKMALWMTAALFLGAFAASLAATEGGGLRDGTWYKSRY